MDCLVNFAPMPDKNTHNQLVNVCIVTVDFVTLHSLGHLSLVSETKDNSVGLKFNRLTANIVVGTNQSYNNSQWSLLIKLKSTL